MAQKFDLIIIGEGIAGLTCAAEAARAGMKVATVEAEFFGGLVVNINELQCFEPAEGDSGMTYAGLLAMGNKKAGVQSIAGEVTAINARDGGFEVQVDGDTHEARFVVIASGAHWKKLGVPGEAEFNGRGVSHCADCDAPMFSGDTVVVAGAGTWALQSALLLAQECEAVAILNMDEGGQASDDYMKRAKAEPKIQFHPGLSIQEIVGNESGMTGVRARDAQGGETEIPAAGIFAVGTLEPNSAIAPAGVRRDAANYLEVSDELETSVPGLFAIGQVRAGFGGWLDHAVADAKLAAKHIQERAGQA